MATDILMPALSPTMTEGTLARWHKKPGDKIAPGDVIAEIETDKATMEVEAVDEGTLAEIKVPEGTQGVKVNAVIATMNADGEKLQAAKPQVEKPHKPAASKPEAKSEAPPKPAPAAPPPHGSRIAVSPLAKRLAQQAGVDLGAIKGSGPHGRIVKADIHAAPQGATSGGRAAASGPSARQLADALGMKYELRPNSGFRKTIARRLSEAKQTIPHFYLTVDCEIDALLELRKRYNAGAEGDEGKVSVNDFAVRAAALALRKVPDANVSWSEEGIVAYADVDISVAVATPNGLITPIIKNADTKSLRQIAAEMRDLAGRAREGKLKPQEYQGGTFSISNLGMFGIREFSAVINPPQSCILAVGAGEKRAVVKNDQLAVATIMTCTVSVDHRAVDGAFGAQWFGAFKKLIEDPYSLLL